MIRHLVPRLWSTYIVHSFYTYESFFRPRLNFLTFLLSLGWKYSCIIFMNNYWMRLLRYPELQGRGKCYQPSRRPRLITLTETLIILDITKTEFNNCFIIHCFEKNNDKYTVPRTDLTLLLEIMQYRLLHISMFQPCLRRRHVLNITCLTESFN